MKRYTVASWFVTKVRRFQKARATGAVFGMTRVPVEELSQALDWSGLKNLVQPGERATNVQEINDSVAFVRKVRRFLKSGSGNWRTWWK